MTRAPAKRSLTIRMLEAMSEALGSRLAGEIDIADEPDAPALDDYEKAHDWVLEAIDLRRRAKGPASK